MFTGIGDSALVIVILESVSIFLFDFPLLSEALGIEKGDLLKHSHQRVPVCVDEAQELTDDKLDGLYRVHSRVNLIFPLI